MPSTSTFCVRARTGPSMMRTLRADVSVDGSLPHRRPRVLLADDHPLILASFNRLLKHSCNLIGTASSGENAITATLRLRPDILVVDLMFSDVNGLEVCRRVKQEAAGTDVVIVTAFDDMQIRQVALHAGAAAFVAKHSAPGTLEDIIQRIFAERQRAVTTKP